MTIWGWNWEIDGLTNLEEPKRMYGDSTAVIIGDLGNDSLRSRGKQKL